MSTNLNNLKLKELIFLAKNVTYINPEKKYEDLTEDERLFEAINYGLNSRAQIDSLFYACTICPPIKLLAKERIKRYILKFMK